MGQQKQGKPSGLSISRNGNVFKFTWKNSTGTKDTDLQYATLNAKNKWSKWSKDKISKKAKKVYTKNLSKAYGVTFRVRDDGKDTKESGWVKSSAWVAANAPKPGLGVSLDQNLEHTSYFSWEAYNTGASEKQWYEGPTQWKYFLLSANGTYFENVDWTNIGIKGTQPFTETGPRINSGPILRWMQVRATYKKGTVYSDPQYHVYAIPNPVTNLRITKIAYTNADSISASLEWTENNGTNFPGTSIPTKRIEKVELEYAINPPAAGMLAPASTQGTVVKTLANSYNGGTSVTIERKLDDNEALFFRVRTWHDKNSAVSPWIRDTNLPQTLSNPEFSGYEINTDNRTVVINVENTAESYVADSFVAISYRSIKNNTQSRPVVVGILPHGEESLTITCPENLMIPDEVGFGVQALAYPHNSYYLSDVNADTWRLLQSDIYTITATAVPVSPQSSFVPAQLGYCELINGNYVLTSDLTINRNKTYYEITNIQPQAGGYYFDPEKKYYSNFRITTHDDNGTYYKTYDLDTPIMSSETEWQGGEIAKPPTNLDATMKNGVAIVTWDWTWSKASYIELGWADHIDAWESTEPPNTYRIEQQRATKWSIYGMDSGSVWYVRARFIRVNSDSEAYGPWSQILYVNLTSAPDTPILELSKSIVTMDEEFNASWIYVTTDNSPQQSAKIFEVHEDAAGKYIYGSYKLATVQYTEFDPKLTYYIKSGDSYVVVSNPIEEDFETYYIFDTQTPVAETATGLRIDGLTPTKLGWEAGKIYRLSLILKSQSQQDSKWSTPVQIEVAEPLEINISQISLSTEYETVFDEEGVAQQREISVLKNLPFTITVTGSGDEGTTSVYIERQSAYFIDKPDENEYRGYENESIVNVTQKGEGQITINYDDLVGSLDDGASYRIVAVISDAKGQRASISREFVVSWGHKALMPEATVDIDKTYAIAKITVTHPQGIYHNTRDVSVDTSKTYYTINATEVVSPVIEDIYNYYEYEDSTNTYVHTSDTEIVEGRSYFTITGEIVSDPDSSLISSYYEYSGFAEGDVCDIYRLSADKPRLIVSDGQFNTTYVDPYPTIGEYGGYRAVYRTKTGDYITEENTLSWFDYDEEDGYDFKTDNTIINFNGGYIELEFNIDLSNSWSKDFKETKYLGGHVQGDWNPAVSRTGSVNTAFALGIHSDQIKDMRRLADHSGICNVRTREGSSFPCNIDVTESLSYNPHELMTYSLTFTRVDSEGLDGMTLAEWNKQNADIYNERSTYSIGDYAIYGGFYYICISEISTPEPWTPSHWRLEE